MMLYHVADKKKPIFERMDAVRGLPTREYSVICVLTFVTMHGGVSLPQESAIGVRLCTCRHRIIQFVAGVVGAWEYRRACGRYTRRGIDY